MTSWQNKMEIAPEVEMAIGWIMSRGYLGSSRWMANENPTPSSIQCMSILWSNISNVFAVMRELVIMLLLPLNRLTSSLADIRTYPRVGK